MAKNNANKIPTATAAINPTAKLPVSTVAM
jgi:hypothetical protein